MGMPESTFKLPRNVRRTIPISILLESKSRLEIEYYFMTQLARKGRLRTFTHYGKLITLWWLGLATCPILTRPLPTPGREKWHISTAWNSLVYLTHWISSTVLTRLLAQHQALQCHDPMFHLHIFLMKLIPWRGMKQPTWNSQYLNNSRSHMLQ